MTEARNADRRIEHGERCDCVLLAQALRVNPSSISFEYCQRVLHKNWRMNCRHGSPPAPLPAISPADRWRDIGPIDSVKAVLISNQLKED